MLTFPKPPKRVSSSGQGAELRNWLAIVACYHLQNSTWLLLYLATTIQQVQRVKTQNEKHVESQTKKNRLWIDQVGWSSCSIGVFDRITNIILGAFRMHELVQTKGTLQLQFHRRDLVAAGQTHFMKGLSDLCHLYSSKHQTSKVAAEMVRTTRTSAGYSST